MAWTTINYSCGHVGQVQMYGKHSERGRKAAWMEKNALCDECAAKARDEGNRKAAATNAEAGLPSLTGTPKQIAWAETLRTKAYALFLSDHEINELLIVALRKEHGLTEEIFKAAGINNADDAFALFRAIISKRFAGMTQASAWIDSRPMYARANVGVWDYSDLSDSIVEEWVAAVKAAPAPKRAAKIGEIMRRAWQIARDAAAKLGCALKEIVFGACLKQAWAEARA